MYYPVKYFQLKKKLEYVEHNEVFTFRTDRPLMRVQAVCFWILKKLNCHYMEKTAKVTRIGINADDLIQKLIKANHVARDSLTHIDKLCILMGPDEFEEMIGTPGITHYMEFNTESRSGYRVLGLNIHIIPYMQGLIVVPEKAMKNGRQGQETEEDWSETASYRTSVQNEERRYLSYR